MLTPDGPSGPPLRAKPGAVMLAQLSGAPILPMACAVDRAWRLSSWDRLILPQPFSRVVMAYGAPLSVPRELSSAELDSYTQQLQLALDEVDAAARAALAGD